ncbi:MAG: hypothetical protein OEQ13_00010 [Acidobacteriota bacterium]|nr:hypothetical protein [Acidobacteriota bacterium]
MRSPSPRVGAAGSSRRRLHFDAADLLLFAAPLLALFPLRNNDLWWHLATGRWILAEGGVPHRDPFSFTGFMGAWVDNEWLSQVALYGTWLAFGNAGLVLLRASVVACLFLLIRQLLVSARRSEMLVPAVICGISLSYGWWGTRPSMFSLVGTLVLLLILERLRRSSRFALALPALFLVWANTHPGFFFGLAVLLATLAGLLVEPLLPGWPRWSRQSGVYKQLAFGTLLSIAATLVNPYGWRVYAQQLVIARNTEYRSLLDEWAPPSACFVLFVLVASAAFVALRFRKLPLASLAPILGAAALSTTAVRFEEYFALVAIPAMLAGLGPVRRCRLSALLVVLLLAASLALGLSPPMATVLQEGSGLSHAAVDPADVRLHARMQRNVALLAALVAASLALAGARRHGRAEWLLDRWRGRSVSLAAGSGLLFAVPLLLAATGAGALPRDLVEPERYPDRCAQRLPGPEEHVLNRLSWGGWLIWTAGTKTYIDGRSWGQPIFFEYHGCDGPGCAPVLARRDIDWVIVGPTDPPVRHLSGDPAWETVCQDDAAVLYHRLRTPSRDTPSSGPPGAPLSVASRERLRLSDR